MAAYYNENDPFAAAWLRELIKAGHIAQGEVDERSIVDIKPSDLAGFTQCHFFAGIGGWSYALRLAGWPDDKPVWTGSCPCQPFSAAGKGAGFDDERHLWPAWFHLIEQCRPSVVFGEQVDTAIRHGWLDLIQTDLEASGYAFAAVGLPAASVGAPHIRQRLWFVADTGSRTGERNTGGFLSTQTQVCSKDGTLDGDLSVGHQHGGAASELAHSNGRNASTERQQSSGEQRLLAEGGGSSELADSDSIRCGTGRPSKASDGRDAPRLEPTGLCAVGELAHGSGTRLEVLGEQPTREECEASERGGEANFWSACDWLPCIDGKARPVEPGTFPLAHGVPARVGRLRGYGNAIVPQVAAEVIAAYLDAEVCR